MVKSWVRLALLLREDYKITTNIVYEKFKTEKDCDTYIRSKKNTNEAFLISKRLFTSTIDKENKSTITSVILDGIVIDKRTKPFKIVDTKICRTLYWNGEKSMMYIPYKMTIEIKHKLDSMCEYKVIIIQK